MSNHPTAAEVLAEMFANSRDPEQAAQFVIDQLAEAGFGVVRMAGDGFRRTVAQFAAAHKAEKKEAILKMAEDAFNQMIAEGLADGSIEPVPGRDGYFRNVKRDDVEAAE
jgi:hypothetical protein